MTKKTEGFETALESLGLEATERQLREQNFRLREKATEESKKADALRNDLRESQTEVEELATELSLYRADWSARPEWLGEVRDEDEHQGTLVTQLSDVHAAEVVEPGELGGYNAYNLDICEKRIRRYFERTVVLARSYLAGVNYDGIVLSLGGDLVNGDIHEDSKETNEVSPLRACELLVPWVAAGVELWRDEFKRVHIVSNPGNHPRDSQKPRHKKRSEHNADTHIANLLAGVLASDDITFDIPESADVDFTVYGYVFSAEHGDNFHFSGTSEIGALGPVKRGNLRKTKKRQEEGRPFRYGLYGHFHQYVPAHVQGFVMNGSVVGYNEFASNGQFTPEPPMQSLMVVTPEHGISMHAPILVSKRSDEGW